MYSLLKWIWGGIKAIGKRLFSLLGVLWDIVSSVWTWICAAVMYLVSLIGGWISDAIGNALDALGFMPVPGIDGTGFANGISSLAEYILIEWMAMDIAIELLLGYITFWITCKTARLAMVPIRAALDLL